MAPIPRRKTIWETRTKRRIHAIVPWIQNPLQGVDKQHLVFAPRREASTLELFFDLFFVANLATFTAYHSIVDHSSLFAYVGFFAIIWVAWFHTVLHDVRFENDSIYGRACKTVIMIAFVGFALVGTSFAPGTKNGHNINFRILCYTLVLSRTLFAIQYIVVGFFVGQARRTDLYLPIFLNALTYVAAAVIFAAMVVAFPDDKPATTNNGIYSVWWIVMFFETVATIAISCFWRILSFKKTHLVERMGLLTLIVIGEGAVGVTKTISRLMGKSGLDPEGSGLILCIVLILMGTWMIYFDNHPHGHFGTIRQQIWSTLHFPIHLAIVGLLEGAQQVALARYVAKGILKLQKSFVQYCFKEHLDGEELRDKLQYSINYLQLDKKLASLIFLGNIEHDVYAIGNSTGICGPDVVGSSAADFPSTLRHLFNTTMAAMYSALGLNMPLDEDVVVVMFESWKLVYRYFWASFLILMGCFVVIMVMIRTTKVDAFDYMSLFSRGAVIVAATSLLGLSASRDLMYSIMETPVILPVAVALIYTIIILDRLGAWIANIRNRKSGDPLTGDGHGHGHAEGGHGGHQRDGDDKQGLVASSATAPSQQTEHDISYNPLGTSVVPSYNATTGQPHVTPQPTAVAVGAFPGNTAYAPPGYLPVHSGSHAGDGH